MGKTLSYEEYVKVKNLLTKIKGELAAIDTARDTAFKIVDDINKILTIKND